MRLKAFVAPYEVWREALVCCKSVFRIKFLSQPGLVIFTRGAEDSATLEKPVDETESLLITLQSNYLKKWYFQSLFEELRRWRNGVPEGLFLPEIPGFLNLTKLQKLTNFLKSVLRKSTNH